MDVGLTKWKIMLRNTNIIIFHICAVVIYTKQRMAFRVTKKGKQKSRVGVLEKEQAIPLKFFIFHRCVVFFVLFVCFFLGEHLVHTAISAGQLHNAITCTILQVTLQTPPWSEDTRVILILQIFISNPSWFFLALEFLQSCFLNLRIWEKKLHPRTNSHNIQAATNTVAPLLTFYKNFILKIQALCFESYNSFYKPSVSAELLWKRMSLETAKAQALI